MNQQSDKAMSAGTRDGNGAFGQLRPFLAFLRRRMVLLLVWPALALAAAIVLWAYVLLDLEQERSDRRAELQQQVDAYARSYIIRTRRSIGDTDRLLLLLRHQWATSGQRLDLSGTIEAGIFSKQYIAAVALIDGYGRIVTSTHPDAVGMYVGDQAYFVEQQRAGGDSLYLSGPMDGRLSNREVIAFTRPLLAPGGRFDGIVLVTVFPSFFTQHYAEPILREHGMVGLTRRDGSVVATRAGSDVHSFHAPFLRAPMPPGSAGVRRLGGQGWFVDGRMRVVGWQPFPDLGLIGFVGLDEYSAMAPYREHRETAFAGAWWNTAWIALVTLLATSFYVHAKWRRYQVESIRSTYRLATEEAGEGFFINRPLRDRRGVIRDFEIVDCNQHGADMFGKRPEQLIGHRLSEFYDGELFRRACARLCKALAAGIYDRELEVPPGPDQLLRARWIRYKAVRAGGDDLAVTIRDISESKAHLTELERRSNSDGLTGLPNRYWIQQYLPTAIEAARAGGHGLAVLFVDLDGFKTVNDALGHAAGDELLRTVGKRLKTAVRPRDHVVRLGGDEFVVLLEQTGGPADVEHVAGRVLGAFRDGFHLQRSTHVLNASIGISLFPEHGGDAETLLKHADIAMYSVKTEGKGQYRFFQSRFYEAIRTRLETEMEMRRALDQRQFVVHYQPRVDLSAGTASSMEALVRWERPGKELIGPDRFIPLAEETGLIVRLGEQVVDSVCRQLAYWSRSGAALVPVSVNVSPRQFSQCDILALFRSAIARHGIDPALLEIELTESSMMQEGIGESGVFGQLRELGIKLCIDDFGTGYSSLSQLQRLRFDVLKIDRAFVLRIEHPEGDTLIASMIAMAHALGMRVVAEGVENQRQMQLLQTLGCDEGQGYFFSRPVPPGETQPVEARAFQAAR